MEQKLVPLSLKFDPAVVAYPGSLCNQSNYLELWQLQLSKQ